MLIVLMIFLVLALIGVLYLLSLIGARKHPELSELTAYHYAHRGLHESKLHIPENSLRAFRLAVEKGYGAELDVHLSKDGRLVVMHDESLKRTANVDKSICDCTAEELDGMHLEFTDEKIPYLEEVLPLFEGKTPLIIELKPFRGNHAALARKTCAMLRQHPNLKFCIESFDPRALFWLRRNQPKIIRGQLSCNFLKNRHNLNPVAAFILTNLMTNFLTLPHFAAYQFEDRSQISLRFCKKLWGVQEFDWTIRCIEDAEAAVRDGAVIIFEHCQPK
ncbi:MAG: glycerophosphodiester phosphodiesterase family protein [Faecousia sp.]